MTTSGMPGPGSMRFSLHEVLSGMLASMQADSFTDDAPRLVVVFEDLSQHFPLFAPMAAGVDPKAVTQALDMLVGKNILDHVGGKYTLTPSGRDQCMGSKRTLFNKGDIQQLEEAAKVFDTL
ncbi:MAG: hypothetical protein HW403_993 [Dehalococcoidia bacterium]|nr:hypothetical protein [Dehalococcoidia bacterium]